MVEELRKIITDRDQWVLAEGENNAVPFILRFRPHLQPFIELGNYKTRLIINLNYKSDAVDQLPSDEQFELFQQFEDKIIAKIEDDLLAILAFVYTGGGQKEWHFYTQSLEETEEKISEILNNMNSLGTVELFEVDDPEWEEYHMVLSGAKDSDEQ